MATKQELEVQVAELQKRLDEVNASGVVDVSPVTQGLTDAEVDAKIAAVKKDYETQLGNIQQAREEDDVAFDSQLKKLRQENMDLVREIAELHEVISKTVPDILAERADGVVLDGKKCVIIFQNSVLELIDAWRKHFVDETDIAIVVKRI